MGRSKEAKEKARHEKGLIREQIDRLIDLGYHKELEMSPDAYAKSIVIPEGLRPIKRKDITAEQSKYWEPVNVNIPTLVETRVPLARQAELASIRDYVGAIERFSERYRLAGDPYIVNVGMLRHGVVKTPARFHEVVSFVIQFPDIARGSRIVIEEPTSMSDIYVNFATTTPWIGAFYDLPGREHLVRSGLNPALAEGLSLAPKRQ